MGIQGLMSYIEMDQSNYTNYALHNTRLVIDAENFATYCYSSGNLTQNYGGEYLEFVDLIEKFLDRLRLCHVEPLFIFGGCHDQKGMKTKKLISRAQTSLSNLQSFTANLKTMDLDNPKLNCNITPRLLRSVLLEVLRKHNIYYVASQDEADRNIAELALYLNCPIASGDSDFYIYRSPNSYPYIFVPFKHFGTDCQQNPSPCCPSNMCWSLPCKMFQIDGPSLGSLSPWMLSLFAIFSGNDNISDVKLPSSVTSTYFQERLTYSHRRIRSIIQWLRTFAPDSKEPLNLVLDLYDPNQRSDIEKWLQEGLAEYQLNPERLGCYLNSVLGLNKQTKSSPTDKQSGNSSSFTNRTNSSSKHPESRLNTTDLSHSSSLSSSSAIAAKLLQPQSQTLTTTTTTLTTDSKHPEGIFHRWPTNLISLFQKLYIVPSLIEPIYIENGVVSRISLEDLCIPESVGLCAHQIHRLHCSLMLDLELHLKCSDKLLGFKNGQYIEYRRSIHETIHKFTNSIQPLSLPRSRSASSSFLTFFQQSLNLMVEPNVESRELQGLACMLTLWFRRTAYEQSRIWESSLGLSFVCCTLVTHYNIQHPQFQIHELIQHYLNLVSLAKSRPFKSVLTIGMIMQTLHQLSELQDMAYCFSSLIWLVDSLTQYYSNRSNHSPFSPNHFLASHLSYILFPSCKLLFWLTQSLEHSSRPSQRFQIVMDYWIPNFLFPNQTNNYDQVRQIQLQFRNFIRLVDHYLGF